MGGPGDEAVVAGFQNANPFDRFPQCGLCREMSPHAYDAEKGFRGFGPLLISLLLHAIKRDQLC